MIPVFSFELRTKILFGCGRSKEIADEVKALGGHRVLLVTDAQLTKLGLYEQMLGALKAQKLETYIFDEVLPNPKAEQVDCCGALAVEKGCDAVIAVGGGSVMDVAKGAAVVASNGGRIEEYLYLQGEKQRKCVRPLLPVIAVPTTSGTGSEVSECIVITDSSQRKDLMLTPELAPVCAILDPELTYGVPARSTAMTGLDVLGHAIESYVAVLEDKMADLFALEAIRLVFAYLPAAVQGKKEARDYMALASMYAGIAQSKNGCIIPHAVSCPLSVHHKIPHGYAVGIAQIPSIRYTRQAASAKYEEIAEYLGMRGEEDAAELLIQEIHKLFRVIGLEEQITIEGLDDRMLDEMASDALLEIDIEGSPVQPVKKEDLVAVYKEILR